MKKLIILAMIGLIGNLTSCQKADESIPKDVKNNAKILVERNVENCQTQSKADVLSENLNDTSTQCHTDWGDFTGKACIWSQGYLVEVKWTSTLESAGPYRPITIRYWYETKIVSFCSCGA